AIFRPTGGSVTVERPRAGAPSSAARSTALSPRQNEARKRRPGAGFRAWARRDRCRIPALVPRRSSRPPSYPTIAPLLRQTPRRTFKIRAVKPFFDPLVGQSRSSGLGQQSLRWQRPGPLFRRGRTKPENAVQEPSSEFGCGETADGLPPRSGTFIEAALVPDHCPITGANSEAYRQNARRRAIFRPIGGPPALAPRLRQQLCRCRGGRVPTFNYTNAENTVVKGIRAVSSWAIDGGLQGLDKEARRTLGPCQGSAHQWVKL